METTTNNPMGKPIGTERARELASLRRTYGAGPGMPRSDAPRCDCGAMTLKRAFARGHVCEPETALVIPRDPAHEKLMSLVLDAVSSPETKRQYRRALTRFLDWCAFNQGLPFNRTSVHCWKSELERQGLEPVTINIQLSAIRKLAREGAANGYLDESTAHGIESVENVRVSGQRAGNWLTKAQAEALINAPKPTTRLGARDRCALALLVGCGLRREEAAQLTFEHIQERDGRWAIVDMKGKRGRIRTIAVPDWVYAAIADWGQTSGLSVGRILRAMDRYDNIISQTISDRAVFDVAARYGREIGVQLKAHDLRRTCAKLSRKAGGALEQIQIMLGHSSIQTTERYLGTAQDLVNAPNDLIGMKWRQS